VDCLLLAAMFSAWRNLRPQRNRCYIESFSFSIGTILRWSQVDGPVLALGEVVTCDPQVGNDQGHQMLPEDHEQLRAYWRPHSRPRTKP